MQTKFDETYVQAAIGLRYGNIRKVGAGGMASVFSAYDSVLARPVAIKFLSGKQAVAELTVRFQQEARLASRLKHPNIVTVLDFGRGNNGALYLVMDLVEGSSLAEFLKENGPMPLHQALKVFIQICDALAHAHSHGVMHRDLKPSNIMIADNNDDFRNVRIVDFGLARVVSEDQNITRTGVMIGTPLYASPEQFQAKSIDHRTDIYSLGCLMFETLTGKKPFSGDNQIELFEAHLYSAVPELAKNGYSGDLAEELNKIIAKAMAKNREERYSTVHQLRSELLSLLPEEAQVHFPPAEKESGQINFKASSFLKQHSTILSISLIALVVLSVFIFVKNAPVQTKKAELRVDGGPLLEIVDRKNWHFATYQKGRGTGKLIWWTNVDCRMGDDYFETLKGKNVQNLKLNAMRFDGYGLRNLRDEPLSRLHMPESKIKDKYLYCIGELKGLEELDLSYSWITDAGLATMSELPRLKDLGLAGCTKLTASAVDSIAKLAPNVIRLSLSYTPVGKDGLKRLRQLKHLEELDLSLSDLTDDELLPLFDLDLRNIALSKNPRLTDKTVERLQGIRRLNELKLDGCPLITQTALNVLRKKHPRMHLITAPKNRKIEGFEVFPPL
jgi:serine/threonine protein kinase